MTFADDRLLGATGDAAADKLLLRAIGMIHDVFLVVRIVVV